MNHVFASAVPHTTVLCVNPVPGLVALRLQKLPLRLNTATVLVVPSGKAAVAGSGVQSQVPVPAPVQQVYGPVVEGLLMSKALWQCEFTIALQLLPGVISKAQSASELAVAAEA